ncbi:MAG: hypothetical protein GC190_21985 [Alphaproteobacteria bacterium]|nr:hypothetical protein [Alphaproteobacteria bacterium]
MFLPENSVSSRFEVWNDGAGSASQGTTLTAGVASSKGSWVTLKSSSSFDCAGFQINIGAQSAGADWSVDIGIDDGAGNVAILVPNIRHTAYWAAGEGTSNYTFPVFVPKGSKVVARCASSMGSTPTVQVIVIGRGKNPGGHPGYSRAVEIAPQSAGYGVVIDPGTTSHTKSGWVQCSASTPYDIDAVYFACGTDLLTPSSSVRWLLDFGIGASGSENVFLSDVLLLTNSSRGMECQHFGPFPFRIPKGSRIAVRAQCSVTNTFRFMDVMAGGLVL